MSAFDETFDAKEWAREHGLHPQGRSLTMRLDATHLGGTVQVPSCASWSLPELGVGQGQWGQHQGFRGTLADLLERARRDVERNQGMYGEAARPHFEAVLGRIDRILRGAGEGEDGAAEAVTLSVHDPSGLCSVQAELSGCITDDARFERSYAETMMLTPKEFPDPGERLSSVGDIAQLVRRARSVVALTGAGISVESGITPFRNPSDGDRGSIWGKFDAAKMTVQNFNADPAVAKGWWDMKRSLATEIDRAAPNPAHAFFAMLERQGKLRAVVTQNIDSLHQRGGVPPEKVIELHGHMRGLICSDHRTELNPLPFRSGECTFCIPAERADEVAAAYGGDADTAPVCPECGCPLRSETVMFGQPMPEQAVNAACAAVDDADLLFVIGSTLIVQPANELPCLALAKGTPLVMVNFDGTQYDAHAKGLVRQKAGEFLGAVADELERAPASAAADEPLRPAREDAGTSLRLAPEQGKQARVDREGRQRGKEISRNARDCGLSFFCTSVAEPEGDFGYLERSLAAMNEDCADIGKLVFSDGPERLAALAFVPEARAGAVDAGVWLQAVAREIGGEVLERNEGGTRARLAVPACPGAHPMKLREPGITAGIRFLRGEGLFLADGDDGDDSDVVYGDHDFPS